MGTFEIISKIGNYMNKNKGTRTERNHGNDEKYSKNSRSRFETTRGGDQK